MICNRYCCLLKMSRSLDTRACVRHTKQHKWGGGYGLVVSVQLWLLCFSVCGETKRKRWSASHIVHTWDGLGPSAHLYERVSSLWSWLNSHQTAEWDQMILTTGKYLWAEKSNSGSAWSCTGRSHQSIHHSKWWNSQKVRGMYALRHLGLLFMSTSQELHDHNVGFGHLQYTIHLLTTKNMNKLLFMAPTAATSETLLKTKAGVLTSGSGLGTFSRMSLACWKCLLAAR